MWNSNNDSGNENSKSFTTRKCLHMLKESIVLYVHKWPIIVQYQNIWLPSVSELGILRGGQNHLRAKKWFLEEMLAL